jgi:hypothetical protein
MRFARVAVASLLLLAPACGDGGTDVTEAASARLQPQVQALREAAATGNPDAANHELDDLRRLVGELSSTGELGDDGARRILDAAERVEDNLALLATTTTTTSTTTTTTSTTTTTTSTTTTAPPPPPPPEEKADKEDKEDKEQDEEESPVPTDSDDTTDTNPDTGSGNGKGNGDKAKD